jgi:DNA-binding CsgD family transcriptional regulator
MVWRELDPGIREAAEEVLTERQLLALKLSEDGAGYWQIATCLDCSRSTARDLVKASRRKVAAALREPAPDIAS